MDVCFIDLNQATKKLVESYGVEGSKKLFMWIPADTYAACPKGRQDNTHLIYMVRVSCGTGCRSCSGNSYRS